MNDSFTQLLTSTVVNDAYCIYPQQKNYFINNTYGNNPSQLINIYLNFCDNKTMNNTCKPIEEIQSTLSKYYIYVFTTDISIDNNKIDPVQKIISYQPYQINPYVTRIQNINYKKVYYNSDFNLFYNNLTSNIYHQIDSKTWDFGQLNSSLVIKNNFYRIIITINSEASDFYSRSYQKIPQIIAQVGSFYSLTMYLLTFISERLLINFPYQIVFDKLFKKENLKRFYLNPIQESQILNVQDSHVNNFIKQTSMNRLKIENNNHKNEQLVPVTLSSSIIDYWNQFNHQISQIIQEDDQNYFRNSLPCRKNKLIISKIEIGKEIFMNFFDAGFIFTNIMELMIFKDKFMKEKQKF